MSKVIGGTITTPINTYTKEQIKNLIGSGGISEITSFVVNFVVDADGNVTADKTYDEVQTAIQNNESILALLYSGESMLVSSSIFFDGWMVTITFFENGCAARTVVGSSEYWFSESYRMVKSDKFKDLENKVNNMTPPVKGVDYWTDEDKAAIKAEITSFVVNFVVDADGNVTADKTYDEVQTAIQNNERMQMVLHRDAMRCASSNVFSSSTGLIIVFSFSTQMFTITNIKGNKWSYSEKDWVFKYTTDSLSSRIAALEGQTGDISAALDAILEQQGEIATEMHGYFTNSPENPNEPTDPGDGGFE